MTLNDQQFETILTRLDAGETLMSIREDFPDLEEDIQALHDIQDFFAAQRLSAKPSEDGLRNVLRQVKAMQESQTADDRGWGEFFMAWRRNLAVALPAFLILGISGYVWQQQVPEVAVEPKAVAMTEDLAVRRMEAPALRLTDLAAVPNPNMDMKALAESLSAEFASDLYEFEATKSELEPFYDEQLFSYNDNSTTL